MPISLVTLQTTSRLRAVYLYRWPKHFRSDRRMCNKHTYISHSSKDSEFMLAGIAVRTGVLQAPDFWEHVVNLRSNIVTMKQPNGAANFQDIEMYHVVTSSLSNSTW